MFTNSQGDKFKIIEYKKYKDVTIQFLDPPYCIRKTTYRYVEIGAITNPYHVNDVGGFIGEGYEYQNAKYSSVYSVWYKMLVRCNTDKQPAYANTKLDPRWLNYSEFAKDYVYKMSFLNPNFKYQIDKDLLYPFYCNNTGGYKYYSNETTVLIPADINSHLITLTPICYSKDRYDRYKSIINKLENHWATTLKFYLENGGLTPDIYNILENLRIGKLNEYKRLNPIFEAKRLNS